MQKVFTLQLLFLLCKLVLSLYPSIITSHTTMLDKHVCNACLSFLSTQTNTFQCVLATNGSHSFVLFLYVEDLMRWTGGPTTDQVLQTDSGTDGLASDNDDVDAEGEGGGEGPFAIIGFNAGDGVRSTSLPWSQTSQVLNVADYHNTANPENSIYNSGLWIYRVDEASVVVPSPGVPACLNCLLNQLMYFCMHVKQEFFKPMSGGKLELPRGGHHMALPVISLLNSCFFLSFLPFRNPPDT